MGAFRLVSFISCVLLQVACATQDNWCKKDSDCVSKIGPSCHPNEVPKCHLEECYCDPKTLATHFPQENRTVLLAGATGKTGLFAYAALKKLPGVSVRALVRNVTKAKALLGCNLCDETEGIYVGDVTKPETLVAASKGVNALVSTLGSDDVHCKFGPIDCHYPEGASPKDINWNGNKALAVAVAKAGGRQVVLMSTMGTTKPDNYLDKLGHGFVSFYSLQAETWLEGSGLDYTIVKACGLGDGEAGKHHLITGHDDASFSLVMDHSVPRADVARVLTAAVADPELAKGLRFDFCSSFFGDATADAKDVFKEAMFPWDPRAKSAPAQPIVV